MRSVTGIDDAGAQPIREKPRGPGRTVAQHNDVRPQGLKIQSRVLESFSLLQTRCARGDIDDIRTETHGCEFKGCPRSRAGFDKKINQRLPAQSRNLLETALTHPFKGAGSLQEMPDLLRAQVVEAKEILSCPATHDGLTIVTLSGVPSRFSKRTLIRSSRVVGRFFPT